MLPPITGVPVPTPLQRPCTQHSQTLAAFSTVYLPLGRPDSALLPLIHQHSMASEGSTMWETVGVWAALRAPRGVQQCKYSHLLRVAGYCPCHTVLGPYKPISCTYTPSWFPATWLSESIYQLNGDGCHTELMDMYVHIGEVSMRDCCSTG